MAQRRRSRADWPIARQEYRQPQQLQQGDFVEVHRIQPVGDVPAPVTRGHTPDVSSRCERCGRPATQHVRVLTPGQSPYLMGLCDVHYSDHRAARPASNRAGRRAAGLTGQGRYSLHHR